MSWKADFAYIFYKLLNVAEGGTLGERHQDMIQIARAGNFKKFYDDLATGGKSFNKDWAMRIIPSNSLASRGHPAAEVPWFAAANRERFPGLFLGM
mmetsp:Transcript_48988/g.156855  ORF Transcript_48988/g.156855 Transcript_48988/m.156855 type:complete len:96 (-) Transcript_48988:17-304(-)